VLDLETTGLSELDCIVEAGAVEIVNGQRTGSLFHSYCQYVCLRGERVCGFIFICVYVCWVGLHVCVWCVYVYVYVACICVY
jgi:Exonuclease